MIRRFGLGALVLLASESLEALASWEEILPQHTNRDYRGRRPRTRYSHTATTVGKEVIVAFGYFYDFTDGGGPTWDPDVWAMSAEPQAPQSRRWRLVTEATGHGAPTPRMNHLALATPDATPKLLIFAGDGANDVKFNDVWELDISSGNWRERRPVNTPPVARNCFSGALVGGDMLVYGGFHLGDIWRFVLAEDRWELLMDAPQIDHIGHPGKRAGSAAVADATGEGMYVYGGFRFEADVSDPRLGKGRLEDLWHYRLAENRWYRLEQVGGTQGGRQYMDMALVPWWKEGLEAAAAPEGHGLVVFGGTQCDPKCNLVNKTSVYSLHDHRWYLVEAADPPMHRYHHGLAYSEGALWVFGGESYSPHMYHNSIQRLAWPPPRSVIVEAAAAAVEREQGRAEL